MLKKDYDHAIDYYREAHERFPETSEPLTRTGKLAWLSYRQGRTEEAKKEFTQHLQSYPTRRDRRRNLLARANRGRENDLPLARAWYAKVTERYRNYYYGHLASRETGEDR